MPVDTDLAYRLSPSSNCLGPHDHFLEQVHRIQVSSKELDSYRREVKLYGWTELLVPTPRMENFGMNLVFDKRYRESQAFQRTGLISMPIRLQS